MSWIDIVILAVIAAALVLVLVRFVRRRRAGVSSCTGCSCCSHADVCPSAKDDAHT
ncbi:MAG: FeoB-associated Cys-rich membrane protein [Christensenellaceae bacterium]|nr:FeoB-associated Cys-rich membrane protein [Christensenellaceae bacterium]